MFPSVEIACEFFEGDETKTTLKFPNTDFTVLLHRFIANEPQNLDVKLYCAIGYVLGSTKTLDEVKKSLRGELHCEGCVSDIVCIVSQKRKKV